MVSPGGIRPELTQWLFLGTGYKPSCSSWKEGIKTAWKELLVVLQHFHCCLLSSHTKGLSWNTAVGDKDVSNLRRISRIAFAVRLFFFSFYRQMYRRYWGMQESCQRKRRPSTRWEAHRPCGSLSPVTDHTQQYVTAGKQFIGARAHFPFGGFGGASLRPGWCPMELKVTQNQLVYSVKNLWEVTACI